MDNARGALAIQKHERIDSAEHDREASNFGFFVDLLQPRRHHSQRFVRMKSSLNRIHVGCVELEQAYQDHVLPFLCRQSLPYPLFNVSSNYHPRIIIVESSSSTLCLL